jgi:membrane associated rhomboid family serine protease
MLSDRQYMRDRDPRGSVSMLTWVIVLIVASFVAELVCLNWIGTIEARRLVASLELTPESLRSGHVWTLFTYGLLHQPNSILHVLGNVLAIFFFGRAVLPRLGSQRFVGFCVAAILVGGLAWLGANWSTPAALIGASALAVALLVLFACFNPDEPISLLLFFVLPVSVRPKYLAWFVVGLDGLGLLFYELPQHVSPLNAAHSAHLGGALAAWVYARYLHHRDLPDRAMAAAIGLPTWFRKNRRAAPVRPVSSVRHSSATELRVEVDRILDKINSDGFSALTPAEKRVLDEAKDILSRR